MIPNRLLRNMTLRTATTVVDPLDGSAGKTYTSSTIRGRVDQVSTRESRADGREITVDEWRLFTNDSVSATGQVIDGAITYEIEGEPWPVYRSQDIHHFEAKLRKVNG